MSEEYFAICECEGCVMLDFNCAVYSCIPEVTNQCPCHDCLVKVTCSYDDVCEPYSDFMDKVQSIDEYVKRIEIYDTKHNSDPDPHIK